MIAIGRARILRWAVVAAMALGGSVLTAGAAQAAPAAVLGGGSGIYVEQLDDPTTIGECTLTAIGFDRDDRLVGLTAGHCGEVGARIAAEYSIDSGTIGVIAEKSEGNDWAVIAFDPDRVAPTRQVAQTVINGVGAPPNIGDNVCKNGRTTGFTCGVVWETKPGYFRSQVCADQGDSGGPVLLGDQLVGMIVAGSEVRIGPLSIDPGACAGGGDFIHRPEVSTNITLVLGDIDHRGGVGAGFRVF
ncbi:S1 family peptidase [Nocardia otitidiscaviarum]|uniref:S1 family peptidase n=1 Tax=Nocardia otitidiscaviarum TaxID=1823 RepID=UPI0004A6BB81|nr:S1 family peptidase [Nocardia otitidiscaviarum]